MPSVNESQASDELAKDLVREFERKVNVRREHGIESDWTNSNDYCYLNGKDPHAHGKDTGYSERVFDGIGVWALEQSASGLHGALTNLTDRWFSLGFSDPELMENHDVLVYLQELEDILYYQMRNPQSSFGIAIHQSYLSDVGFGNSVPYVDWSPRHKSLAYKTFPVAQCYWDVDYMGLPDSNDRLQCWNARQIEQAFGDRTPSFIKNEANLDKTYEVIHMVFPRANRLPNRVDKTNKRFASYWVLRSEKQVIDVGGYNSNPYQVTRWATRDDEQLYGKGPAQVAMPAIIGVNQIRRTRLKAAYKAVDPPVIATEGAYVGPFNTNAQKVIWKNRNAEDPSLLESRAIFQPTDGEIAMHHEEILRYFFVDLIKQDKPTTEMTAFETADRRDEKFRQMSPLFGRQITEKLDRMIRRSLSVLNERGLLPEPPEVLNGNRLEITYVSPAAKAQEGVKAVRVSQFVNAISPLGDLKPEVFDSLNVDELSKMLANILGVDRRVLNTQDQINALREQRAKQQQMQQLLEAAPNVGKTVKDLAQARAAGQPG